VSFYPQIGNGVVAQFPFRRTRHWRAITNQLESGELITLADTAGGQAAWTLRYEELTNVEAEALSGLFASAKGQFGSFTFIDPMVNLLGWSENLTNAGWQAAELSIATGAADPLGTQRASTVSNPTEGPLALSQTPGISGDYVACFSAYVLASGAGTITLQRDGQQTTASVGPQWRRVWLSGTGTSGAAQSTFSLMLSAGQAIRVFGLQVEAQPAPSVYRLTGAAAGIYEETYFADDQLTMTSTGPGFSRATINLISRI
jgi:hypothetical protein